MESGFVIEGGVGRGAMKRKCEGLDLPGENRSSGGGSMSL